LSLIVSANELLSRRTLEATAPDLAALGAYIDADIARILERPLYVPPEKALLSRWGAHCRDDEAELLFDPFSPDQHRCSKCGRVWSDEQTHRWWVYWYQLWLAERVLMMALRSGDGGAAETRATDTLALLVERYQNYPNADNVLGPSRPFFSTYLESIWVLQLAAASSVLKDLGRLPDGLETDLQRKLFRPSAAIIADFDEGRSNRQVWNAAALFGLGRALGDKAMQEKAATGPSGMLESLRHGILDDGLWYEGENYHWFALRGLTWGAQLLREAGVVDLWRDQKDGARFREAFRAPVLTALPDFTFPARRDSKFGVSLRQRRMAELWEMALAQTGRRADGPTGGKDADFYGALLAHVYDPSVSEGNDGSWQISEVDRNEAPSGVRRGALGWKGWLWMMPELPDAPAGSWWPGTTHLEATGLAIFRRDEGRTYVSLDYGEPGGGHGHPDRLQVVAVLRGVSWLLDFGTGSYVSPSLGWYRSTLAHNAPLVDGVSQMSATGRCVAFDEKGGHGWICGYLEADTAYDGAALQRTVVVTPDYVLDIVQMQSETLEHNLAVPWHGLGKAEADPDGLMFTQGDAKLRIHLSARQPFQVMMQRAPGPPVPTGPAPDLDFPVVMSAGTALTLAACLDPDGKVSDIDCVDDDFIVRMTDGSVQVHRATDYGWLIEPDKGDPVELEGIREVPETLAPVLEEKGTPVVMPASTAIDLNDESQFRRAEAPYEGPAIFSAHATLKVREENLHVEVEVTARDPWFRPPGAEDPEWENENPNIHSDGIQLYIDNAGFFGWLIVPDSDDSDSLLVTSVGGTDGDAAMISGGSWKMTDQGYRVSFDVVFPEPLVDDYGFDLYVNRGRETQERRSGQLIWSGARGTRLYLAGDRPLPGPIPRIHV
jgi:hypothetical protein